MEIIKVKDVSFTYPDQTEKVLEEVNFTVKQGDFIVVFGESGSGKTTLLKLLKRELAPHGEREGAILYKGKPIETLEDRVAASDIGYVMQNPEHQIVTDKVWHELAFGLENLGIETPVIRRRVGEMANFFGIHQWFRKKTSELSGGQKQLLNLASVMAMQPSVLILDEPTSQLDPIAASEFIHSLEKLNKDFGLTIILVEHRLEEVLPIANKVLVVEEGKIIAQDHPKVIGKLLKNHPMSFALPSAVRIFNGLNKEGENPLTVREGRNFLSENYQGGPTQLATKSQLVANDDIVLEMKNSWFRYERAMPDVLEAVDFTVRKGEIVSILGGNGSGKTTLLSVLSGQYKAYRGHVKIQGKNIKKYKGQELYKHLLALLPQDPQTIFLKSTVREDYAEIGKVMGYEKSELEAEIQRIATLLSIESLLTRHPYDLSGGEQQKVALGKILLLKPKIILLDEPTKGIDAFAKRQLREILLDLKKEGVTIVAVTHDVEFAALISDRCGLFFDREILSLDTPTAFFANNNFYTTAANRIARHMYAEAITCEEVIEACLLNEVKSHDVLV